MIQYSVKKIAAISGVSIRTLHHYDKIGLLKPSVRTESRYRLYGEAELLRLQQILFYKELDFSLDKIAAILDDPEFDMIHALENHRIALDARKEKINGLLSIIDKTILKLKGKIMVKDEELYEGFDKEGIEQNRKEISIRYGMETLLHAEKSLKQMEKSEFEKLKADFNGLCEMLADHKEDDPGCAEVQELIARHYHMIRVFWGTDRQADPQWEAYKGLSDLYVQQPMYTKVDGVASIGFAVFMKKAMYLFVEKMNR
jgi:DNA-binding transcriptional MerR regulator